MKRQEYEKNKVSSLKIHQIVAEMPFWGYLDFKTNHHRCNISKARTKHLKQRSHWAVFENCRVQKWNENYNAAQNVRASLHLHNSESLANPTAAITFIVFSVEITFNVLHQLARNCRRCRVQSFIFGMLNCLMSRKIGYNFWTVIFRFWFTAFLMACTKGEREGKSEPNGIDILSPINHMAFNPMMFSRTIKAIPLS